MQRNFLGDFIKFCKSLITSKVGLSVCISMRIKKVLMTKYKHNKKLIEAKIKKEQCLNSGKYHITYAGPIYVNFIAVLLFI